MQSGHLFQDLFVDVLSSAFANGELSTSQRCGVITLVCKDQSKADLLACWRPISLLNVDYKILSKVLSKRLASVLPECIHIDQPCCVPGRSIADKVAPGQEHHRLLQCQKHPGRYCLFRPRESLRPSLTRLSDPDPPDLWFWRKFYPLGDTAIHKCGEQRNCKWMDWTKILGDHKRETRLPAVSFAVRSVHRASGRSHQKRRCFRRPQSTSSSRGDQNLSIR